MTTVDLFCGSGGVTAGMIEAIQDAGRHADVAHAVNHWDLAVAVHGRNFPQVQVHQEDICKVTAQTYGLDRINLLWASPSCVHHSRARGGKPREDQQRAHAWEVLDRWIRVARVDCLLIENVPEFEEWGPLDDDGQPIKARKGEDFLAFVAALRSLGYAVEWRVLCCADYGDPTTRRRFFLQAVRDGVPITWPAQSHRDPRKPWALFDEPLPPWRTAAECIDWSIPCRSIFDRKKPLAEKTLRRIRAGIDRFVLNGKPFIVNFRGTADSQVDGSASGVDEPLRTVSSGGIHAGLVAPVLIHYHSETTDKARASGLGEPLATLDTSNRHGLVTAFLAKHYGGVIGTGLEKPLGTVTAVDHHSLVTACLINTRNGEREGQAPRVRDLRDPMATVTAEGSQGALVAASLIGIDQGSSPSIWPADSPLSTTTTKARHALVAAFLTQYYGTINTSPVTDPLDTVTTKDRHALVTVEIDGQTYAIVDIGMRMLEPHELAKAHSLPERYTFDVEGKPLSKAAVVKMIGNMVPVRTARALILNVLEARQHWGRGVVA